MDTKSPDARSINMARIRNTRTKPEMYIRSELHRNGFRFRVNYSVVTGKPDIYFTKKKIALFVHGCFWHQHHGCRYCTIPKSNIEYWLPKLERNLIRDQKVLRELTGQGIKVIIIWECAIKHMKRDIEFHEIGRAHV